MQILEFQILSSSMMRAADQRQTKHTNRIQASQIVPIEQLNYTPKQSQRRRTRESQDHSRDQNRKGPLPNRVIKVDDVEKNPCQQRKRAIIREELSHSSVNSLLPTKTAIFRKELFHSSLNSLLPKKTTNPLMYIAGILRYWPIIAGEIARSYWNPPWPWVWDLKCWLKTRQKMKIHKTENDLRLDFSLQGP